MRKVYITIQDQSPEGSKIAVTRTILTKDLDECKFKTAVLWMTYEDLKAKLDKKIKEGKKLKGKLP